MLTPVTRLINGVKNLIIVFQLKMNYGIFSMMIVISDLYTLMLGAVHEICHATGGRVQRCVTECDRGRGL